MTFAGVRPALPGKARTAWKSRRLLTVPQCVTAKTLAARCCDSPPMHGGRSSPACGTASSTWPDPFGKASHGNRGQWPRPCRAGTTAPARTDRRSSSRQPSLRPQELTGPPPRASHPVIVTKITVKGARYAPPWTLIFPGKIPRLSGGRGQSRGPFNRYGPRGVRYPGHKRPTPGHTSESPGSATANVARYARKREKSAA